METTTEQPQASSDDQHAHSLLLGSSLTDLKTQASFFSALSPYAAERPYRQSQWLDPPPSIF